MADRRLQIFYAVAKHRSFSRAAESLFMTQPAVTFQIRQLEAMHKVRLLERKSSGIELTPAGELVKSYAERILALDEEMTTRLSELTDEIGGTLVIGASQSMAEGVMSALLREFNARYPQVKLCLNVGNSAEIAQQVLSHRVDLGLIDTPDIPSGLLVEKCGEGEMCVVCAPTYPLSSASGSLTWEALIDHEYLAREPGSGSQQAFQAYVEAQSGHLNQLKCVFEVGNLSTMKALLMQGIGLAVLPKIILETACESGELKAFSLTPPLFRSVSLIYPEDRFRTRLSETFSFFVRNMLREKDV